MANSILMVVLLFIVIFVMARPILSQAIGQYSQEVPEDVTIFSTPDFDIYVEAPDEAPFEAESPNMDHYSYKQLDFLEDCLRKLSSKCGDEIFKNVLDHETTQILLTDECCHDLLKIGKDCHLGLVQFIFSGSEYKNIASKAIPKSKHMWNDCVRRFGSQIGVPISLED